MNFIFCYSINYELILILIFIIYLPSYFASEMIIFQNLALFKVYINDLKTMKYKYTIKWISEF